MERVERHLRTTKIRLLASVGIYAIFLIIAIFLGVQGTTMENDRILMWMIALIAAFVTLPQSPIMSAWPDPETEDEQDRLSVVREELTGLHGRVVYMRMGYLVVAAFCVVVLPRVGI